MIGAFPAEMQVDKLFLGRSVADKLISPENSGTGNVVPIQSGGIKVDNTPCRPQNPEQKNDLEHSQLW
jgi:hypothetical protein